MSGLLIISAILLGFGGSLHCLGMCGPLVMSLPFQTIDTSKKHAATFLYVFAKALGYGLIGTVFGTIGKAFLMMNWQQTLSITAGVILLLITVLPYLKEGVSKQFLFGNQFNFLYQKIVKEPELTHFFTFGLLNAFLPCGLVYTALAGATISLSPLHGFIFMFLFGIGTSPALVSIIIFKNKLNFTFRKNLKSSTYYFSLLMAFLLILRGMNLGIPYLSPQIKVHSESKKEVIRCCIKK